MLQEKHRWIPGVKICFGWMAARCQGGRRCRFVMGERLDLYAGNLEKRKTLAAKMVSNYWWRFSLFLIPLPLQLFISAVCGGAQPVTKGICGAAAVHGYHCNEFHVTTSDGYVLGVYQILQGVDALRRPPVLLQHGVLLDGMSWVINVDPRQNLPTILADNGFDVWISNIRGTQFSRRHLTLQPTNPAFWDWSWDELAAYEIPSVIEFIVSKTGQNPHYIGHSMGTLIALALLSEGKFQNVKSAVLLSPIAHLTYITSPLVVAAARLQIDQIVGLGFAEFNPRGPAVTAILTSLCKDPTVSCYDLLTAITGENCCLNKSTIEAFVQNEPQPTSTKNIIHFAQTIRSGVLSKYNYGDPMVNSKHYGNSNPPLYNLSRISGAFPLLMSYGGRDSLSDPKDVSALLKIILESHEPEKVQLQYIEEYAHLDFIMGINAKDIVYNKVVDFFKSQQV